MWIHYWHTQTQIRIEIAMTNLSKRRASRGMYEMSLSLSADRKVRSGEDFIYTRENEL
jgi:hypothetical protein